MGVEVRVAEKEGEVPVVEARATVERGGGGEGGGVTGGGGTGGVDQGEATEV